MQAKPIGKSFFNRKAKLDVYDWGEAYRINCFYCGDSRQRLYINHRWDSENYTYNKFVKCYNEECQTCPDFRDKLVEKLKAAPAIGQVPDQMAITQPVSAKVLDMPGDCIPVHKLPGDHLAVQYLLHRGFDLCELGEQWGICWVDYSPVLPRRNRLFVPFYDWDDNGNKILVGGQARWLDPATMSATPPKDSKEPKWFTLKGTRPSQTLFNGWRVQQYPAMVVLVEGPFDAMRLGPSVGVALFGHSVSYTHRTKLWKHWGTKGGTCVLWLDPDMNDDDACARQEQQIREQWGKRLIRIKTQGPRDVADMTREEALNVIEEAIRANKEKGG
jgi:hypothetical protein